MLDKKSYFLKNHNNILFKIKKVNSIVRDKMKCKYRFYNHNY